MSARGKRISVILRGTIPRPSVVRGRRASKNTGTPARLLTAESNSERFRIAETAPHLGGIRLIDPRDIGGPGPVKNDSFSAERLQALGRIAAVMAHELNNQLTVIIGATRMRLDRLEPKDPGRRPLEQIFLAGERAACLV